MVRALGALLCVLVSFVVGFAARPVGVTGDAMRKAALEFSNSLTAEQRAKASFAYDDAERRDWHYVPRDRRGIALGELSQQQRALAQALLRSGLGESGARKVDELLVLESILRELEGNPGRDPGRFYLTLFGDLAGAGPFGWRFEGHHASLNFSSTGAGIATTPHFLGSNPARVRGGEHDGLRLLALEEDLGHELVRSLDAKQRSAAVLSGEPPGDVILGPSRNKMFEKAEGVRLSELTPEQRALFWKLADVYADRFEATLAEDARTRLHALAPDDLRFAWIGSLEPGQPHYYRIQGPRFAIEYDNGRAGADHVHTLWRDLERDFGDALREHYEREHK